ncbi:hypothetical protein [Streptomyces venezuelae]
MTGNHLVLDLGPDLDTARGVPFSRRGAGVPRNGETFAVPGGVYSA